MVKCPHAVAGCNYPEGDCPGHCASKQQPEALRLADCLDDVAYTTRSQAIQAAAAELRRLHAENEDFRATCDHLTRENAEQIGEIVALKEQRDELLEALAKLVEDLEMRSNWKRGDDKGVVDCGHSVYLKARAAIAKAGGAA